MWSIASVRDRADVNEVEPDIWVVRHGATEWSDARRHTGRSDLALTDAGKQQAAALCRPLNRQAFSLVLTSPLVRARDTARIAGFADAAVDENLLEWDYGVYEGRTTAEIQTEIPGWSVWTHPVMEGEALDAVAERARRVLDRCAAAEGRVLLIAHAHILRIITACALGLPPVTARVFTLDPASISVIGREHDYRALRRWNWLPT